MALRYGLKSPRTQSPLTALKEIFYAILALMALITIGMIILINGLDHSIDNQNKMLCASALESGNTFYRRVCFQYYKTGDIKYLRGLEISNVKEN